MYQAITSLENLFTAWQEFRRGKRSNPDVQLFERHLEDNSFRLHWELSSRSYRHRPYHRFQVFDPKHRIIHKAEVRDRVVHHAIYRKLAPLFEPSFIFDSYSCRIGKGTHAAVERLEKFVRQVSKNYTGPCWALKCDIRKFFDSIDHARLFTAIQRKVSDADTLGLLRNVIQSFGVGGKFAERERERAHGIPIGNLTSQLFANVYMDAFDHFAKETLRAKYYLRYTDDFILLADNPEELMAQLAPMRDFLGRELKLELHPRKIILKKLRQGIDFLGYVVLPHYRVLRTRTKRRMYRKFRQSPSQESLDSYLGLLKHAEGYGDALQLRRMVLEARRH